MNGTISRTLTGVCRRGAIQKSFRNAPTILHLLQRQKKHATSNYMEEKLIREVPHLLGTQVAEERFRYFSLAFFVESIDEGGYSMYC